MNYDDTWTMNSPSPEFIRQQEELWRAASRMKDSSPPQDALFIPVQEEDSKPAAKETILPLKHNTHLVQEDDESATEDISHLLEDCAMIEEQRRILQAIEEEQRRRNTSSTTTSNRAPVQREPSTSTTEEGSSSSEDSSVACQQDNTRRNGTATHSTTRLTSCSSHSRREVDFASQDQMIRMGNKNVKVKGTSHTYQSIADGKATIVQCSSCAAILQVGKTAKLVFCGNCQQVTPIETARNICINRVGSTDAHIARSLQAQELDVAYARKTAKLQSLSS